MNEIVKVRIKLHNKQHLSYGRWRATIDGKEKIVNSDTVEYYCPLQLVMDSFLIDEVISYSVEKLI